MSKSPPDLDAWPSAAKLVKRAEQFLNEIQTLTPGKELEKRLNEKYGPGNQYYEDFCKYIKIGVEEGWVGPDEIDGPHYRRGKISLPSHETLHMSMTAVYFDVPEVFAGDFHKHPYGEINCVIPIDPTFQLEGLPVDVNWQGAGWTCNAAGTYHFPRARGGKGVAFFFFPAGRIGYDATPGAPNPTKLDEVI